MKKLIKIFNDFQNRYSTSKWKQHHSFMQAPLLRTHKEYYIFFTILLLCASISITLEYQAFIHFKNSGYKQDFSILDAIVLQQYQKSNNKGEYTVLKLKSSSGITFYTTTKEDIKNLQYRQVRVTIINKKINFIDYLKGFYAFNIQLELLPQISHIKDDIRSFIFKQHHSSLIANFYGTLFLADALNPELRNNINALGVAHLMAISGFHYGVICAFIFGILYLPYYQLQKRFFPYRNAYYDLSFISLVISGTYLLLLDNSPSFLRAFMMALWGFVLMISGINITSLASLFFLVFILFSIFPSLFFSIGFWFSVLGVFYILIFLKHYSLKTITYLAFLQIGIYLYMLPITHYFFAPFSPLSTLCIVLTPLFTLFYPLSIILHLIGYGNLFDTFLQAFFELNIHVSFVYTSIYFLIPFFLLSIAAIFNKKFFWALNAICFSFFLYLLVIFLKQ